jgi:hypothetical protein
MLAAVGNFFNPWHVLSVGILRIGSLSLPAARQGLYHGSLALLTSHLDIQYALEEKCTGLTGVCRLAMPVSQRLRGSAQ